MREVLSKPDIASGIQKFAKYYFQMEVIDGDRIPRFADQNSLLVMNHTAFFGLEVYLLGSYLLDQDPEQRIKTMVWRGFTEGPAGIWFRALGCETATIEEGTRLVKEGNSALIMPEGVGATDVRNRFNKFHTGFLRMLQKHPVPIVPIGFYGVDEAIPWFVSNNKLLVDKLMKPIDPSFDFMIIPKVPVFRPTKIVFKVGEPIHLTKKDLNSEKKIQSKTREIQSIVEQLTDEAKEHREEMIHSSLLNTAFHKLVQGKITYI